MKQYSDNDIEVLGEGLPDKCPMSRRKLCLIITLGVLAVILVIAGLSYMILSDNEEDKEIEMIDTVKTAVIEVPEEAPDVVAAPTLPTEFTDSINDVAFTVVELEGFKASVSFDRPDPQSDGLVMALPAADYRADNGRIVGEFIHEGQQLSRGVRKPGFCYIDPEGRITIGSGDGERQKEMALQRGGTFFRQYALVMDGEMQPNVLKGKSRRRAIGFLDNKPVIILSANRESIYDFSQALTDYGLSHALYLPGGECYLRVKTTDNDIVKWDYPDPSRYANYLIFER